MQEVAYPTDPRPKVRDPETRVGAVLSGKRGLVVGIANENSIACRCAARLRVRGAELGEKGVRVYAVSPGPLETRAASGIPRFDELVDAAMKRCPARRLFDTRRGWPGRRLPRRLRRFRRGRPHDPCRRQPSHRRPELILGFASQKVGSVDAV
jgi:hypothetical protein